MYIKKLYQEAYDWSPLDDILTIESKTTVDKF